MYKPVYSAYIVYGANACMVILLCLAVVHVLLSTRTGSIVLRYHDSTVLNKVTGHITGYTIR